MRGVGFGGQPPLVPRLICTEDRAPHESSTSAATSRVGRRSDRQCQRLGRATVPAAESPRHRRERVSGCTGTAAGSGSGSAPRSSAATLRSARSTCAGTAVCGAKWSSSSLRAVCCRGCDMARWPSRWRWRCGRRECRRSPRARRSARSPSSATTLVGAGRRYAAGGERHRGRERQVAPAIHHGSAPRG